MLFLHVSIEQPSCAKLCRASRHLTSLVADTVMKLNVCPQIVNGRKCLATIRDVTLHSTHAPAPQTSSINSQPTKNSYSNDCFVK